MMSALEIVWSHAFPLPMLLITAIVGVGVFAQRRGIGMPPQNPYEITNTFLKVNGSKFGGPVPLSDLVLEQARVVDLSQEQDLQPHLRTMGIGTKGYKSGWFRLRNSRRALVHITDPGKVVCIPTSADYMLLLSAENPETFISALKSGQAIKVGVGTGSCKG